MTELKPARYLLENGQDTTPDDPLRQVWYSAGCSYWTDDWNSLACTAGTIPACPNCLSVGYQAQASAFLLAAKSIDRTVPGYVRLIPLTRNRCLKVSPAFLLELFRAWDRVNFELLNPGEKQLTLQDARALVAEAWCQPTTSDRVMDPALAEELAKILVRELGASHAWNRVAVESNRAIDAYCRSLCPDLPEHYGMPLDAVKHVVRAALAAGRAGLDLIEHPAPDPPGQQQRRWWAV